MHSKIWSLASAAVLAAATQAQAQTSRGTVSRTILDPSGAVVASAAVALTHTEAGVRRTVVGTGDPKVAFQPFKPPSIKVAAQENSK